MFDLRAAAAKYYDANPRCPDDVPFYRSRLAGPQATVLELGCGTGRVLLPLARACAYICGLDESEAMLAVCREKLRNAAIGSERAVVQNADIGAFSLGRRFDLVIAPFRVLQNLETDEQVDSVFDCARAHLAPGGRCILNVFRPIRDAEGMRAGNGSRRRRCSGRSNSARASCAATTGGRAWTRSAAFCIRSSSIATTNASNSSTRPY